jgi:hypothetical protein
VTRERETTAEWSGWDGSGHELLTLGWETGGWTADGVVRGADVHYVVRVDEQWRLRQFLLFRDQEEPDLWLGVNPAGQWGEINGAYRPELDGCIDLALTCTPFTESLPMKRLLLGVGDAAEVVVALVDEETLQVTPTVRRYERIAERRWVVDGVELEVDDHDLVLDHPGRFRRLL